MTPIVELYPHQKKAVQELATGKILVGSVGTGKSRTAIAYYMLKEEPKPLYVITTGKKRDSLDWQGEAAAYGVGLSEDATVAGVMTIDSFNNIEKYADVRDAFFIFDEQRLVGSGAWVKAFLKIVKSNNWIMLSATPGDSYIDYAPVFIANGFYRNRTDFVESHVIWKAYRNFPMIDRYVCTDELEKHRRAILVEMPYPKHTVHHNVSVPVSFDKGLQEKIFKKRWHIYEERPIRDIAEMFRILRKVVNTDPSRLEAIRTLMKEHPKLIIFYNMNYELDILLGLADEVALAQWNGHKHQDIPDTDRWVYLVQFVAGAEGWECIETNAVAFYSLPYSYRVFHQAHGRIDRLNTPFVDLYYYTLRSESIIDHGISKSLKAKKNFNEAAFVPF